MIAFRQNLLGSIRPFPEKIGLYIFVSTATALAKERTWVLPFSKESPLTCFFSKSAAAGGWMLMKDGGHVLVKGILKYMDECVCESVYFVIDP